MKPRTRALFDVDSRVVTDIYVGDAHYRVEGSCTRCGACCASAPMPSMRAADGGCQHRVGTLCGIEASKPWFCKLFPYSLGCVDGQPPSCTIRLVAVDAEYPRGGA